MKNIAIVLCLLAAHVLAAATGSVRGVVHDPQHRPVPGAQIVLHDANSTLSKTFNSDANGEFQLNDIPEGVYRVAVSAPGFRPREQGLTVTEGKGPVLHIQLELAGVDTSVEVSGAASKLDTQVSTVQTMVTPQEIARTAGADQTNSLAMITDFTPGAYMVHDMLHLRGGHQVNWFFDGIPVVNTNIAANVAPLINPKNVEELEIERGGFSSEYGDRTYGFFNVVTPSGFERNNEMEIIASAGNFYSTDDQINMGSHTQRFAYYASIDGNRSQLGLAPPVSQVIHDQSSGVGGFVSLFFNPSAKDQLRWIASVREDHYQIPNPQDAQAAGIRDLDLEQDDLIGFHWTHSFADGIMFTLAPYYHFNSAHYVGGPNDTAFVLDDNARSNYFGGRSVLEVQKKRHSARDSLAGPSLNFAVAQGFGFIPLPGERDIQHDIGLSVPVHGWSIDVDNFHTSARNFLDHDVVGNSGIFIPLTDLGAIISGTEVTLRSPRLFHTAQWRVAYSNQIGQGIGPITGGLLEFAPSGNFLLDHDQRNTVTSVLSLTLPGDMWATPAYQFGSGFLNGNGPSHLPPHSTFDLSIGKTFRERVTVSVNAVNIANTRYLLDTSNTFGGTHFINPRQIYGEVKYRFHF